MRVSVTVVAMWAVGCGGDGSSIRDAAIDAPVDVPMVDVPLDATPANSGFAPPTLPLTASTETSPDTFQSAVLDLSCLGSARSDLATSASLSVTLTVRDFQSDDLLAAATVKAFDDLAYATPFATTTTDNGGVAMITVPTGTKRYGVEISASASHDTYTLDLIEYSAAQNHLKTVYAMSNATTATLPALVGESVQAGDATVLGRLFDCAGHTMSNFIATISSTPAVATMIAGVHTYYFSSAVGLPVRHSSAPVADVDGRYMIIHVPATTTAYLQMWGYVTSSDVQTNHLELLAELPVSIIANGVFVADHDPRATH